MGKGGSEQRAATSDNSAEFRGFRTEFRGFRAEFRGFRRFSFEFIDILVKIHKKLVSDLGANLSESSLEHADMGQTRARATFHFSFFLGSLWGLWAPFLSSFRCLWGSPWGPLGCLGGSLVTLGGYFGLTLLDFGPPWPPFGELWQHL